MIMLHDLISLVFANHTHLLLITLIPLSNAVQHEVSHLLSSSDEAQQVFGSFVDVFYTLCLLIS